MLEQAVHVVCGRHFLTLLTIPSYIFAHARAFFDFGFVGSSHDFFFAQITPRRRSDEPLS